MRYLIAIAGIGLTIVSAHASNSVAHNTIHPMSIEPAPGRLRANQVIYVDDGTCPAGQIKMVIGAPDMHTPRQKSCVPH